MYLHPNSWTTLGGDGNLQSVLHTTCLTHPKLFDRFYYESKGENNERSWVRSLVCSILGVDECVGAMGWKLEQVTSGLIIHIDLHKTNNKLVSA